MKKILLTLAVLGSTSAFANSAGCGLGSLLFQKDTIASQTLAETFNASTATQFFGITTGTSNCTAHGFAFQEKEATVYAESNLPSLKMEMARGQGENLVAFSQIMGCSDAPSFSKMAKDKYQTIFPSYDVTAPQMIDTLKLEIKNDPTLSKSCNLNS